MARLRHGWDFLGVGAFCRSRGRCELGDISRRNAALTSNSGCEPIDCVAVFLDNLACGIVRAGAQLVEIDRIVFVLTESRAARARRTRRTDSYRIGYYERDNLGNRYPYKSR